MNTISQQPKKHSRVQAKQKNKSNNNRPVPTSSTNIIYGSHNTIISVKSRPLCGISEIPRFILKYSNEDLAPSLLTFTINKSFSQNVFHNSLKLVKTFPKLKNNLVTSIDS